MSDNYSKATVVPSLPKSACTPERLLQLERAGFKSKEDEDTLYFFAENGIDDFYLDDDFESQEVLWQQAFQAIAAEMPGVKEIVIEGAYWSDKLRPGEFGG